VRWLVLALALASCGAPVRATRPGSLVARQRSAEPSPMPACEDLRASGESRARACAIAELDPDAGVVEVFVRVEPDALPAARRSVTLTLAGETHDLGRVDAPAERRLHVALTSAVAPGQSFRHAAGWHLHGRSFVPELRVDGEPVDVPATLLLRAGDAPVYTSAGPSHALFDAPSFGRLADESYEVGALTVSRREVDGDTLWVGASDRADAELEAAADVLAQAYRLLREALGRPPTDSLLLVLHAPAAEAFGQRAGSSVVWAIATSEDPAVALAQALAPLVRLWFTSGSDEPWLRDGVPEYLATRAAVALLDLGPDALARVMIGDARAQHLAFCLDAHLRESSSSLAALLRTRRGPITAEALLEDIGAISGPTAGYLAALAASEGEFPIDQCLERIGYAAEVHAYDGPTDAAVRAALGVVGWTALSRLPALRVDEVAEASALEVGDLLLAVGGEPVADVDDVAWGLREAPDGGAIALSVRRRGDRVSLDATLGELVEREAREHTELVRLEAGTP